MPMLLANSEPVEHWDGLWHRSPRDYYLCLLLSSPTMDWTLQYVISHLAFLVFVLGVWKRWWSPKTVAVVTGSNRGIGFEIARQLGRHGLHVIITSRHSDEGQAAMLLLQKEGLNINHHPLDVLDSTSVKLFAEWILENYDGLDILTYSHDKNVSKILQVEELLKLQQVKAVYERLKALRPLCQACYKTDFEQTMVAKFSAGLSPKYEVAKVQMLTGAEIPDLAEAYNRLSRLVVSLSQPQGESLAAALAMSGGRGHATRGRGSDLDPALGARVPRQGSSHRSWRRAFFVDRSSWKLSSLNAVEVPASVFRLQPIRAAVLLLGAPPPRDPCCCLGIHATLGSVPLPRDPRHRLGFCAVAFCLLPPFAPVAPSLLFLAP
ncbi:(+)-neomenthol dehydrogenase [Nymphaea thermarum]|nr:(+)-neomenthol dehydrogenase [Nymphaea thermarum]